MTKSPAAKGFRYFDWADGSKRTEADPAGGGTYTGLDFPSNGDAIGTVQMRLSGAAMPDIAPLLLIWRLKPRHHVSYYTTFFHGRTDGDFTADTTYVGCHPYPDGGPGGTTHKWELAAIGGDYTDDDNANSTVVEYDRWFRQSAVFQNISSVGNASFYWDHAAGTDRVISRSLGSALANSAFSPALTYGDAPWSPTNERLSGVLRGLQVYQGVLSAAHQAALSLLETDAEVLAYCSTNGITSLWMLCMNPTPSDISDKSGNGHHLAWLNSNRPELVVL